MAQQPRSEHPRPQFERETWINLNGTWSYEFDFGKSGAERGFAKSTGFNAEILVPFCPESKLSGVEYKDFIEALWYHRKIEIPQDWDGKLVLLHFGGVDYECEAFVDGVSVGRHWGGSASFTFDITKQVRAGDSHDLVVHVRDDTRSGIQPGGKQSVQYRSARCHYTRTTGIWQTVWLEAVVPGGLRSVQIVPDLDGERFSLIPRFYGTKPGWRWRIMLREGYQTIGEAQAPVIDGVPRVVPARESKAWMPENPFLYQFWLQVHDEDQEIVDRVTTYAGMRKVQIRGNQLFLNNMPYYLRLVLDQGFYPDGIWTAPTDEALREDIELAMIAGFNGARLHQKVFEERYHLWADTLGFLTWGESASWGIDVKEPVSARNFLSEWGEVVMRDRNHPSIIAWTPFNETRDCGDLRQHNRLHRDAYDLTKALDPTRPVNDASGYVHVNTDLWTEHSYEQDPQALKEQLALDDEGQPMRRYAEVEPEYGGQPYLADEFGGIKWIPATTKAFAENSWGYGNGPKTEEDFYLRLQGLVDAVLSYDHICGYCYTQLTDVEQEQNGIYLYDRGLKFDMNRIKAIFSKTK
jgi:beta-galactosidase/beta-glucuronidase